MIEPVFVDGWTIPVDGLQFREGWVLGLRGNHWDADWVAVALRSGMARRVESPSVLKRLLEPGVRYE